MPTLEGVDSDGGSLGSLSVRLWPLLDQAVQLFHKHQSRSLRGSAQLKSPAEPRREASKDGSGEKQVSEHASGVTWAQ